MQRQMQIDNFKFEGPPQLTPKKFKTLFGFEFIEQNILTSKAVVRAMGTAVKDAFGTADRRINRICQCQNRRNRPKCTDTTCTNRRDLFECPESCGKYCCNCPFRKKLWKKKFKLEHHEGRGWGLHTMEEINEQDFVMEYVGEVFFKGNRRLTGTTYACSLRGKTGTQSLVVEPKWKGGLARFMGHSHEPNCEVVTMYANEQLHAVVVAIRHINPGEELTWHYGDDFRHVGIQTCLCLSARYCPDYVKGVEFLYEYARNMQISLDNYAKIVSEVSRRLPKRKKAVTSSNKGQAALPAPPSLSTTQNLTVSTFAQSSSIPRRAQQHPDWPSSSARGNRTAMSLSPESIHENDDYCQQQYESSAMTTCPSPPPLIPSPIQFSRSHTPESPFPSPRRVNTPTYHESNRESEDFCQQRGEPVQTARPKRRKQFPPPPPRRPPTPTRSPPSSRLRRPQAMRPRKPKASRRGKRRSQDKNSSSESPRTPSPTNRIGFERPFVPPEFDGAIAGSSMRHRPKTAVKKKPQMKATDEDLCMEEAGVGPSDVCISPPPQVQPRPKRKRNENKHEQGKDENNSSGGASSGENCGPTKKTARIELIEKLAKDLGQLFDSVRNLPPSPSKARSKRKRSNEDDLQPSKVQRSGIQERITTARKNHDNKEMTPPLRQLRPRNQATPSVVASKVKRTKTPGAPQKPASRIRLPISRDTCQISEAPATIPLSRPAPPQNLEVCRRSTRAHAKARPMTKQQATLSAPSRPSTCGTEAIAAQSATNRASSRQRVVRQTIRPSDVSSTENLKKWNPKSQKFEYYCKRCKRFFPNGGNFNVHMREAHHIGEKVPCSYKGCKYDSWSKKTTRQHERTHLPLNQQTRWQCPTCKDLYGRRADVRRHYTRSPKCAEANRSPVKVTPARPSDDENDEIDSPADESGSN